MNRGGEQTCLSARVRRDPQTDWSAMSRVIVAKFGGSSLADAAHFETVKEIIEQDPARKYVVPSAPGKRAGDDHKVTDLLLMCHQLADHNIDPGEVFTLVRERYTSIRDQLELDVDVDAELLKIRERIADGATSDYVASRGEYLNGLLLAEHLGYEFVDAADVIRFNGSGEYDHRATMSALRERLSDGLPAVIPGFYGADEEGEIRTFSRGGSDVTGAILARGVRADLYENWTDVSGFLQVDPRIVPEARPIEVVTYKELRELSYMGASVLHEEAIFPVREKGIPIQILNTDRPEDPGTLIVADDAHRQFVHVTGIAGMRDFTVVTLDKALMNEESGFLRKLVSVFETNGVSILHVPSGIDSVSVIVRSEDIRFNLNRIIAELRIYCQPDSISILPGMALLAVVGRGMIQSPGIAGKIFSALADAGVNIRMISQGASELSIIIGVEDAQFDEAIRALYRVI